ncbi:hypothetical protein [Kineosporia succinea]|uniref:hypothetical protein n=1 Tax=Kineosporia succinea TaxID=84632 RepID=UPI0027D8842C|nr:hypothetical protein [Kineosporia succinea]
MALSLSAIVSSTGAQAASLPVVKGAVRAAAAGDYSTASAVGYQWFGSACATVFGQKVCWPGGYLGHSIKGSKLKITREDANVEDLVGAGVVGGIYCNYQFTFSYYNTSGDLYRSRKSPMVSKCTSYGDSPIGHVFNKDITLAHAGRACARFIANGKTLATQCHNISK